MSIDIQQKSIKLPCRCRGTGLNRVRLKDLGTLEYEYHIVGCSSCNGKGYITKEDIDSYLHSMGVIPCPHREEAK